MTGMTNGITPGVRMDRDECIEQAYFFRVFRERTQQNMPAQDVLSRIHEELLTTTRMPMAVQFLASEIKHTRSLETGFARLPHYFTPFQTFIVGQAEKDKVRFSFETAMFVLEREAVYKSGDPFPTGLFVYQFESIARNKLGYDAGLAAVGGDPLYGPEWRDYIDIVRRQVGVIDFCDLVYVRSDQYVVDERRVRHDYTPPVPPLFGEKEGRIAKASRGRDPLFLFAALQRQLNYPEVPRPKAKDDLSSKFEALEIKFRELEARLRMAESELRGTFDPTQFGTPDILKDLPDEP